MPREQNEHNASKAKRRMTIDQLLKLQDEPQFLATVEPVPDKPKMVKVTPWVSGGCLCHLAINIPKQSIAGVTPIGEPHHCCGKNLRVVDVHFAKDGQINLQDLFTQLSVRQSVSGSVTGHGALGSGSYRNLALSRPPPTPPTPIQRCRDRLTDCTQSCLDNTLFPDELATCLCNCRNVYCFCSRTCIPQLCPVPQ